MRRVLSQLPEPATAGGVEVLLIREDMGRLALGAISAVETEGNAHTIHRPISPACEAVSLIPVNLCDHGDYRAATLRYKPAKGVCRIFPVAEVLRGASKPQDHHMTRMKIRVIGAGPQHILKGRNLPGAKLIEGVQGKRREGKYERKRTRLLRNAVTS